MKQNPHRVGGAPRISRRITPQRVWLAAFGVWIFLLTGVVTAISNLPYWSERDTLSTTAPGLIQLWRLTRHLDERNERVAAIQREMTELQSEIDALETNPIAQEREVRRTLNYMREDELVFEVRESRDALSSSAAAPLKSSND